MVCRPNTCDEMPSRDEGTLLHEKCLQLVVRESPRFDVRTLFILSAWRRPWSDAPDLCLSERFLIPRVVLQTAEEKYALIRLSTLPPELVARIKEFSESSVYWRYISVLEFVSRLENAVPGNITYPLCKISSWHRGGEPVLANEETAPYIRLTIDSRGLRMVERLPEHPTRRAWQSKNVVYAVCQENQLRRINAHFQVPMSTPLRYA